MPVCGWAQTAGKVGCEESRPTPVLNPRTFQIGTSCYSNYVIMAHIDVDTGAVFIVDAFSIGDIYFSLRIIHALFLSCFSTQHCISPPLFISPFSVQNTVYHTPSISLLFRYTTLYSPPTYFSPVSVHNTVYHPRYIFLLFQYTTLYITHALYLSSFNTQHCISPTSYYSPVLVQNTVYHTRSISLLFQYTTLYITHVLFYSFFSTQKCISPTNFISLLSVFNTVYNQRPMFSCFSTH